MFNTLRRWLGSHKDDTDAPAIVAWAAARGYTAHRDAELGRLSLEGQFSQRSWRLEYGTPQHFYMAGRELRMWTDLGLSPALHLLLMSRSLLDRLETASLDLRNSASRAQADAASIEDVRCVTTYPRVTLSGSPLLRPHFAMVASEPNAAQVWLYGRLGERAAAFAAQALQAAPFLLMTLRGRLYLHLQAPSLSVDLLEQVIDLYRVAVERAEEVLANWAEEGEGGWANTLSATWHADDESSVDLVIDKPATH